jgi:hypothetical protein
MIDPTEILHVHTTESGVANVTYGSLATEDVIRRAVQLVRTFSPDLYAHYRRLKHPGGKPGTVEDRRHAHLWLLQAAVVQFASEHYPSLWVSKA